MKICRVCVCAVATSAVWSVAPGEDQFIQADVYDALHRAYVKCDREFSQTRSEFITEKLEKGAGHISIEALKKILVYNVSIAQEEIATKSAERERRVSQIIRSGKESEHRPGYQSPEKMELHEKVREIDAFLKERKRYVEVHECVFESL